MTHPNGDPTNSLIGKWVFSADRERLECAGQVVGEPTPGWYLIERHSVYGFPAADDSGDRFPHHLPEGGQTLYSFADMADRRYTFYDDEAIWLAEVWDWMLETAEDLVPVRRDG